MADEAKAAEVAKEAEVVVPLRNEFPTPAITLDGTWGTTALFGCNLVSPKFHQVIQHILAGWDEFNLQIGDAPRHHGVHSIIFREDGNPRNSKGETVFGHALATVGGMAINLEHVFTKSIEDAIEASEDYPTTSIYCNIWHHMILTVVHEMHHLSAMYNDPAGVLENEEKDASLFSMDFSYFLAQNYDIEPPALAEEPLFGKKVLEMLQEFASDEAAKDDEVEFYKKQQMMSLEGIMFWVKGEEEGEDRILKSFREFLHWTSQDEADDPKWAKLYTTAEPAQASATPAPAPAEAAAPVVETPAVAQDAVEVNAYTGEETYVPDLDPYMDALEDEIPWDTTPAPAMAAAGGAAASITQPAAAAPAPAPAPAVAAPAAVDPALMPNSSGMAHGLSPAQVGETCMAVYRRLFNHMFTVCGQVKIDSNTIRPDGQDNGCGGFNAYTALQTPVPISDIPNAEKIFVQMDAKVNGRWSKGVAITGSVIGSDTGNKTMLPKYDLYIINDQGHMEKRTLLPQNPWKTKMGADGITPEFSKPAVEAQNGKRIMYIYAGNVMKLKLLWENGREWIEDANWNVIG